MLKENAMELNPIRFYFKKMISLKLYGFGKLQIQICFHKDFRKMFLILEPKEVCYQQKLKLLIS
jgi:hypothetical protein